MHVLLLIGCIGLYACTVSEPDVTEPQGCVAGFENGDCAPDFILPEASGEKVTLSDYRGSVVLLASEAIW